MKHCLLCLLLMICSAGVYAQGTFSNTGSGLNDLSRYMEDDSTADDGYEADEEETEEKSTSRDPLEGITMEVTDSVATFGNLPEKGNITAHITNADGEILDARIINPKKISINIRRLPKSLFFVTLTYKKYRKAFELNRTDVTGKNRSRK